MNRIIIQESHDAKFESILTQLSTTYEPVVVSDIDLASTLTESDDTIVGVLLSSLTDLSIRFCKLIRESRYCHPWTPIAYIGPLGSTVNMPIGCQFFESSDIPSLASYLSQPLNKTILVVEDDNSIRNWLNICLRKHYSVDTASTGAEGIDKLTSNHYDLLLLDVMLPDPNVGGEEIVRQLRASNNNIPIIVITAFDSKEREADMFLKGANDYLTKPLEGNESIRKRIMSVLTEHHLRNHISATSNSDTSNDDAWDVFNERIKPYL